MAAKKSSAQILPKSKAAVSKQAPKQPARVKAAKPPAQAKVAKKPAAAPAKVPGKAVAGSMKAVAEGSKAPSFSLPDEAGAVLSSTTLAGKPYVLYFYPKDDTPGCTKEACDFRDNLRAFNAQKVRVLGVSPDDPKRHAKFKEKYGLTFTLLSDTEKYLIGAYGVWVKKLNYGREYMGVQRSTFLVDKDGKIAKVWLGVRVPGHVEAVLASL
ncbi:MAG: thioredoxin-dependent thiol peroxidase [Pseudomonadota bacterium]